MKKIIGVSRWLNWIALSSAYYSAFRSFCIHYAFFVWIFYIEKNTQKCAFGRSSMTLSTIFNFFPHYWRWFCCLSKIKNLSLGNKSIIAPNVSPRRSKELVLFDSIQVFQLIDSTLSDFTTFIRSKSSLYNQIACFSCFVDLWQNHCQCVI